MKQERAYAPHCDPSVLHAPGDCEHCDCYPDWQDYRVTARINFSGHSIGDLAPCPSTFFRPTEVIEQWYGNVASPPDDKVWEDWRKAKETPLI